MLSKLNSNQEIYRGDILLFYPEKRNIFQKLIAYFDGQYSHCGVALSSHQYISMTRKGVVISEIPFQRKFDVLYIDIEREKIENFVRFLISQMIHSQYDFKGLFSVVFPFLFQNPLKFFCSEFVSWGLYYIGLLPDKLSLTPSELATQDFIRSR